MNSAGSWQFFNPVEIRFGNGCLQQLPEVVGKRRTLLVTTAGATRRGLTAQIQTLLGGRLRQVYDQVESNPELRSLETSVAALSAEIPEVIVAVGGGSVIDTAKVLSLALASSAFNLRTHLQSGTPLPSVAAIPIVAVPTTAGTGSEGTPFATVWDSETGKKYSLASPKLFPQLALLDPELGLGVPRDTTLSCGLDALSQALESIWNRRATPLTTLLSTQAVLKIFEFLPRLLDRLGDLDGRSALLEASLFSGLAISQTRTALAHSISYPLTAQFGVPHGLACSFTLPAILEFNAADDDGRLLTLARRTGGEDVAALGRKLHQLFQQVALDASLQPYRLDLRRMIALKEQMLTPGRADNNLRPATFEDVAQILARAAESFPAISRAANS